MSFYTKVLLFGSVCHLALHLLAGQPNFAFTVFAVGSILSMQKDDQN